MTPYAIQPFSFPTTVIFVDDSAAFLANLSLQLDSGLAFRMFESPAGALAALNGSDAIAPPVENFFSPHRDHDTDHHRQHVVRVSLDLIHREVHNEKRFDQVSVAVVDFDMPEMNGLEFCRTIKNQTIRKILLTGKADERIAVQAFNEGIIDRFILKQEPDVITVLNRAIHETQQLYFSQIARMLSDVLSVGSHSFLSDPLFAELFREIQEERRIVEHYLACAPEGLLLLDSVGTSYLLIVRTEEQLQSDYEIAFDQNAPEELLAVMRRRDMLPYFWKTQGNYSPAYQDWRACLHKATEFKGKDWYLYTVIKNPAAFQLQHMLSYADYLYRMDTKW
jgi:CheY-like chemotaxis protein